MLNRDLYRSSANRIQMALDALPDGSTENVVLSQLDAAAAVEAIETLLAKDDAERERLSMLTGARPSEQWD